MNMRKWLLDWFHTHQWQKINTWSYRDQRCAVCGKTARSRDVGKPVTEWNQQ